MKEVVCVSRMHDVDFLVQKPTVVCNACAMGRAGLSNCITWKLDLWTSYESLHKADIGLAVYYYKENIDYDNYLIPDKDNPFILVPTKERAIVEAIIDDMLDEGILIESIQNYLQFFCNMDLLYEVADFYKLDRDTLEYWLQEAREETWDGN